MMLSSVLYGFPVVDSHGGKKRQAYREDERNGEGKMVVISMYRGNLHKVSDVPRRWRMPEHKLSSKDFKSLLHRRKRALALLFPESNPKPDSAPEQGGSKPAEGPGSSAVLTSIEVTAKEICVNRVKEEDDSRDDGGAEGSDSAAYLLKDAEVRVTKEDETAAREDWNSKVLEKPATAGNEKAEVKGATNVSNETESRKKEIEERLQVLNAKKHNLVQMLKQILNTEEELKRRNNTQQGIKGTRPSVPQLQIEDAVTPNVQSSNMLRLSSASPLSGSPRRRAAFTQQKTVPHPSRASPRVCPTGQLAQPGNPFHIDSGSSPCPAASGNISVSRDLQIQNPWS